MGNSDQDHSRFTCVQDKCFIYHTLSLVFKVHFKEHNARTRSSGQRGSGERVREA